MTRKEEAQYKKALRIKKGIFYIDIIESSSPVHSTNLFRYRNNLTCYKKNGSNKNPSDLKLSSDMLSENDTRLKIFYYNNSNSRNISLESIIGNEKRKETKEVLREAKKKCH